MYSLTFFSSAQIMAKHVFLSRQGPFFVITSSLTLQLLSQAQYFINLNNQKAKLQISLSHRSFKLNIPKFGSQINYLEGKNGRRI